MRAMLARWLRTHNQLRITLVVPDLLLARVKRRLVTVLQTDAFEIARRRRLTALRPDVVWYPWNGMTWLAPSIKVATVHDVWPFVSPATQTALRRREQEPYRATAAHSTAIIANSHFTKSQILSYLNVPAKRVHVVHMGTDEVESGASPNVALVGAERFVLFVGENEPRKGLDTLVASMRMLPESLRSSTMLVVVGKEGSLGRRGDIGADPHDGNLQMVLKAANDDGVRTIVAGEISDTALGRLYQSASVFAFPSRYEGFGLPVLEAMSHGCPVVASSAASIPEVGGDAARYFPPGDAAALARTLADVLSDDELRASMRDSGLAHARAFSWDATSRATLAVFAQAAASGTRG